jgi:hypothetical protein
VSEETALKSVPWSSFWSHAGDPAAARRHLRRAYRCSSACGHRPPLDGERTA